MSCLLRNPTSLLAAGLASAKFEQASPAEKVLPRLSSFHSRHRGISLLEVLFSIFILSVGLLGLASLIPAGTLDVAEATKADRGGSAGRAAYREVKVRNVADPDSWMSPSWSDDPDYQVIDGKSIPPIPAQGWIDIDDPSEPPPDSPVKEGHSICIDPLFIARSHVNWYNAGNSKGLLPIYIEGDLTWPTNQGWPGRAFPYYLDNDPKPAATGTSLSPIVQQPVVAGSVVGPPRMTRVSLRSWPSKYAPMMSQALAERVFRWQDDLLFDLPTDETLRPTAVADPIGRSQSEGNYTWMATLTPVAGEESVQASQRRLYNYSVVVFYKRNLDMPVPVDQAASLASDNFSWNLSNRGQRPSERIVLVDFLSPGVSFGGGDVRLRLPVMDSSAQNADGSDVEKSDFTNIRPGNWILLSGYFPSTTEHHSAFQWFRVLAVDDGPTLIDASLTPSGKPEWVRDVTLTGPDWDANAFVDVDVAEGDPPNPYRTCYATLVEGAVAVFSKTIELDTTAK